ncbi:hypothetical protein RAS_13640 [Rickettsia asiatica]|uniref:GIY-YIG domain-containing protein n=2 Tax=Rickettsia asiatica TaxID=238800 RepID=A0A510GBE6_9RICK|nr:hypothetical protein RAS_13640 [Rickettsia asiatica]
MFIYFQINMMVLIYIGVTSDVIKRVWQHKQKIIKGFTTKYNLNKLIYFEQFNNINLAISREKRFNRS